jgi:hypothetical protein
MELEHIQTHTFDLYPKKQHDQDIEDPHQQRHGGATPEAIHQSIYLDSLVTTLILNWSCVQHFKSASVFSMSSNSSFTASTAGEVILPNFELLPATMLKGLEDAALSTSASTDIPGDFFYSDRAKKMPMSTLRADDTILVPLFTTENAVPMDSSALAQGPMVYLRVTADPQTRVVFATCLDYSQGVVNRAIAVGALVHFPPPDHVLIAKPNLVDLIETSSGTASDEPRTGEERASKRFCTRAQAEGGEMSNRTNKNSNDRGMSKVMFDLDGGRYLVRDKSDLIAREKELGFAFRALDRDRWDQLAGKDYKLQASTYRVFVLQQGRFREDHRPKAFVSCGVLDQVQGLGVSQKSDETKLLLMGHILVEGDEPTLTLADFVDPEDGIQVSTCDSVCPLQNRPLIAVLKNLQLATEVFLSSEFKNVFEEFIYALEGTSRPLDRVFADFLKYQVEINLRKFFRVVSFESSLSTLEEATRLLPPLFIRHVGGHSQGPSSPRSRRRILPDSHHQRREDRGAPRANFLFEG